MRARALIVGALLATSALVGCAALGPSIAGPTTTTAPTSEATTASPSPTPSPTPTQTPTPTTPSPTPTPSATTTTPSPTPAAPTTPAFTPVVVTDDGDSVANENCSPLDWRDRDNGRVAGVDVGQLIMCDLVFGGKSGSLDFLVPVGATTFEVMVGQLDSSESTAAVVRFQIIDAVSAETLASADLAFGQSETFSVSVAGRNRLRLAVVSLAEEGKSAKTAPAWVEPTFS